MSLSIALAGLALGAAIFLIVQDKARVYAIIAAVVSAIDLAVALHLMQFSIPGVALGVVTGGVMLVVGILLLVRLERKMLVIAATSVTFAGAIELLVSLGVLH